ncbi:hypothetical protein VB715_12450 [Crocosphaera sp. UHCC 0190]|uniref:hypothetical protein n=1 Tax=Crocosphaera sp. UHCC 0190 TaxID=3110246 RepID=UPI002B1EBE13|nr:hypothetical protein [Crocosphaera sp. UHCC 0190]MEA5510576.1 hypothetical protein [Crocosphaera sp. UHCC 0190]
MPNKRSRKKNGPKFHCPQCNRRLWRVGGHKYFIFYQGKSEIQHGFGLTPKKASFLATQNPIWVDRDVWLEEFFCEGHGKIWMRLSRSEEGKITTRLARREDWKRTTSTPDPDTPNCSVSEFTYRMSRRSHPNLINRVYE